MNIQEKRLAIAKMGFSDGFMKTLELSNSFRTSSLRKQCKPFIVNGKKVGILKPDVVDMMREDPDVHESCVELTKKVDKNFFTRTEAIDEILRKWKNHGCFNVALKGWRDEVYSISNSLHDDPLFEMERAGASLFGVIQRGVHINGYVNHPEKGICMWVATRSQNKQTFPGCLDQIVGGGLPAGLSVMECAIKESAEEASIDPSLVKQAIPTGAVSYIFNNEKGIYAEEEYVLDLLLPFDFKPINSDGEVEKFELLEIEKVALLVAEQKFTPSSAAVLLHFLVQHGFIDPDTERNYGEILRGLHSPIKFDDVL
ncbi:DgyrCDS4562 [Dimorphilus gyrociliatus]|uniref:DgyrCDS4562 n=1 Tax=Dimorphilus gyrociliatus TaxID=2664684 RepID=A0A7I8VIT3_9ANNE|nr:DgyrCDS4562 [Dimorphilus gyrociliatus]